jgi:hypothetical protein
MFPSTVVGGAWTYACRCWSPDYMTDECWRILKLLHEAGTDGRIEAHRIYPHAHRFKLYRAPSHAAVDVTLSTIDHLVKARFIAPEKPDDWRHDRYDYRITAAGRSATIRAEEERKADQARRAGRAGA